MPAARLEAVVMAKNDGEDSGADAMVFRKKLKRLGQFRGHGTELISLYVPPNADRSNVMGQLSDEMSQSSNIKSPTTRKNVQGALKRISQFLKVIDFKIPKNGLAVFCGNISEAEGKTNIKLFTVRPIQLLRIKLYWCDSEFHLAPLEEMTQAQDVFAIVALDKREATIAVLQGKKYDIIAKLTSGVPGKFQAGGQSQQRFERLREEAAREFYKRVGEKMTQVLMDYGDKLKGIIVGGPGPTKHSFLDEGEFDYRLKAKIIGILDITYTDESGIREMIQHSGEILKETGLIKERQMLSNFLGEVAKGGLAVYGISNVELALDSGKASLVLVSEGLENGIVVLHCNHCNSEREKTVEDMGLYDASSEKCANCGSEMEVIEEIDYYDYLLEKVNRTGASIKVISTETNEGEQFLKSFEGVGAMLRYK